MLRRSARKIAARALQLVLLFTASFGSVTFVTTAAQADLYKPAVLEGVDR
jgi:hypothetical protein